ncbi:hypothetical protein MMC28_007956 [Mycoblastus sanguinarius]|nr:hypothetical protein [Mycoblastus sanguinarius]
MADQASKEAATKTRIITHMNSDHQDSLIRYLQHYAQLSSFSARNAHLANITFDSLTILSSRRTPYTIPIKPPMTAWSEARPRVVAMDAECVVGLGRSNVTVKRYKEPRGFMAVGFVASLLTYIAFSRRANFLAGSILYDSLLKYVPLFANFCWMVQPLVFYPMVIGHGFEATWMARRRLEKHTVPMLSMLWWKWVLGTFVEGVGSFKRFDEIVREEEVKKEKAKH